MKAFWFSCITTVALIALRAGEIWAAPTWLIAWLSPAGLIISLAFFIVALILVVGAAAAGKIVTGVK